jgi:hypothetical protein
LQSVLQAAIGEGHALDLVAFGDVISIAVGSILCGGAAGVAEPSNVYAL